MTAVKMFVDKMLVDQNGCRLDASRHNDYSQDVYRWYGGRWNGRQVDRMAVDKMLLDEMSVAE